MGIKWTDEQINALLEKAKNLYEVDIPLAQEIRHLNNFIFQMQTFANKTDSFHFKFNIEFRWWRIGRKEPDMIEIPEQMAWILLGKAREMLDTKCNRLTDMLGLDKRTIKKK